MSATSTGGPWYPLSCASVLRVREDSCEVWDGRQIARVPFAPVFPTPRTDRVSPGHLVAMATGAGDRRAIVWRWFDAVALGPAGRAELALWEPGHGEIVAQMRSAARHIDPGTRVYASAGLPGAQWWVTGPVTAGPEVVDVELEAVAALYTAGGLWASVFAP